jgi:hypothetical protein
MAVFEMNMEQLGELLLNWFIDDIDLTEKGGQNISDIMSKIKIPCLPIRSYGGYMRRMFKVV